MALVEASLEASIANVNADPTGTGVELSAAGVTIRFLPGVTATGRRRTIRTPTRELTPLEFRDAATLPGRTEPGFVGGTVIAEGVYDNDANLLLADFLQVEPAETVLLGALTLNRPGTPPQLQINGVPIVMLTDPRLPANPANPAEPIYYNQYGFSMKIETAPVSPSGPTPNPPSPPSSAEGYFAAGVFHAFLFESGDTGELLTDPRITPQISMERASYRDDGASFRIESRGFATTSHRPAGSAPQDIELFRVDLNPATGSLVETPVARARVKEVERGFERWRVEARANKRGGFLAGVPLLIRVKNHSGIVPPSGSTPAHQAFAELSPDVREA